LKYHYCQKFCWRKDCHEIHAAKNDYNDDDYFAKTAEQIRKLREAIKK
jgi:hypothetical protein